jgi:hypothetical protein
MAGVGGGILTTLESKAKAILIGLSPDCFFVFSLNVWIVGFFPFPLFIQFSL